MGYIPEGDRRQSRIICLEDMVAQDSMVRVIDKFCSTLNLEELGFSNTDPRRVGRNSYSPLSMAKLYMFCYEEGIRSSRKIEKACHTNIEVMWLMGGLAPDFKTIADFRRDNIASLTALFYEFTSFLESAGLFGKKLVAIDGTKIKASNSKKRNISKKSLERKIKHHKTKAQDYLGAMDETDDVEDIAVLADKAKDAQDQADEAEELLESMDKAGITEISLTDSDARCMGKNRQGMQVAYNVQTAVDAKCHLVADINITNHPNDHGQLSHMALQTQATMRKRDITFLADKGYYGKVDLKCCKDQGIDCIVAPQKKSSSKYQGDRYTISNFVYDPSADSYICPEGSELSCKSKSKTQVKIYSNKSACLSCKALQECKGSSFPYRKINRQPDTEMLEWAEERYRANAKLYRQRQQVVEHPFGTVKRAMGGDHFLLRGTEKVGCEAALLFTGYNLKRALNVLGFDDLMAKLDEYATTIEAYSAPFSSVSSLLALIYAAMRPFRRTLATIYQREHVGSESCLA
jgi:transposase